MNHDVEGSLGHWDGCDGDLVTRKMVLSMMKDGEITVRAKSQGMKPEIEACGWAAHKLKPWVSFVVAGIIIGVVGAVSFAAALSMLF